MTRKRKFKQRAYQLLAKPVIETKIINGELVFGGTGYTSILCSDADTAIELLLAGETVMLQQWGKLVTQVQHTIEATLREATP